LDLLAGSQPVLSITHLYGVIERLIWKIQLGYKSGPFSFDIDMDVGRPKVVLSSWISTGLNRLKRKHAVSATSKRCITLKVRVERSRVYVGWMRVSAMRVRLPELDIRAAYRSAF
jgi:hypothetical protein